LGLSRSGCSQLDPSDEARRVRVASILGLMTYGLQSILPFAALTCHDVPGSTLGDPPEEGLVTRLMVSLRMNFSSSYLLQRVVRMEANVEGRPIRSLSSTSTQERA
jgi:hypothetical protein